MSTSILNPFEIFPSGEVPIMSFQTDKNGTFNPFISIASGTLIWRIDEINYETNFPSVALTGSEVSIDIFANDVVEGSITGNVNFLNKNIIGELNFPYFTINGAVSLSDNERLTSFSFSSSGNTSGLFQADDSDITTEADLGSFSGLSEIRLQNNSNLRTIIQPANIETDLFVYQADGCNLNITTVDGLFTYLNTFFSSNAPTSNIFVAVNGGTNASPTGGSSNIDLVNLRDVVYPNAGFTFTALIN